MIKPTSASTNCNCIVYSIYAAFVLFSTLPNVCFYVSIIDVHYRIVSFFGFNSGRFIDISRVRMLCSSIQKNSLLYKYNKYRFYPILCTFPLKRFQVCKQFFLFLNCLQYGECCIINYWFHFTAQMNGTRFFISIFRVFGQLLPTFFE